MATKTTVANGPLSYALTWDNGQLPTNNDDVTVAHVCTLANGESVMYATLTVTGMLTCSGTNSITASIITLVNSGASALTVQDVTVVSGTLRCVDGPPG